MDVSAGHLWTKANECIFILKSYVMCGTALVTLFSRKQDQLKKGV